MNDQRQFDELGRLTAALCENSLTSDDSQRLRELLHADAAARAFYLDYVALHGILAWDLSPTSAEVKSLVPPLRDVASDASLSDILPLLADLTTARPLATRTFSRRNLYLATLGTVTAVCAAALLAFMIMPGARSPEIATETLALLANGDTDVTARIVASTDRELQVRSISGDVRTSSLLNDGDTLELDTGTATLAYQSGAQVTVHGPTRLRVKADGNYLHRGVLVASVPARAIGFAVETSEARVVDLGTEFAVRADEKGATEVQVLKGKVEFSPIAKRGSSSAPGQTITLEAGIAHRIESNGPGDSVISRDVPFTPEIFSQTSMVAKSRRIQVEGAYASSTPLIHEINVNNLIGGQGMKGDCHSARCQNTMWTAEYMQIKNEFVLFDLARSHRLELMKVWNWNEPGLLWICVKRADIYVSTSGKGDPLSRPDEWKLMVAKQEFAQGTGKNDYDTPTVIPLGNVEARFVGIVIDDAYGRDPRGPEAKHDCVGLSEVRFFGSHVERIEGKK